MRMGVAQVGGVLGELEVPDAAEEPSEGGEQDKTRLQLWEHWGDTVEVWPNVQRVADRAVGSVMAASQAYLPTNRSLEPTPIPWSAVFDAWAADRSTQDMWKNLFTFQPSGKLPRETEEGERTGVDEEADVDEIIEKLRRNPDLEEHEQRLLGCIVDTGAFCAFSIPNWRNLTARISPSVHYHDVQSGAPPAPHNRLNTHDGVPAASAPWGVPARHP